MICLSCLTKDINNIKIISYEGFIHQLFEARLKHIIKCENCHLNLINIKICECEKRVNQRKSTTVIDGTTYVSN